MIYTDLQKFLQAITKESEALPRLLTIISKDDFCRREAEVAILALVNKLRPAEVARFSGDKVDFGTIMEEIAAPGLFSKERIVFIDGADALTKKAVETLIPLIQAPGRDCTIVLSAPALRKNSSLYTASVKAGLFLQLEELKPWQKEKLIIPWLIDEARRLGKELSAPNAQLLVERLGLDQSQLVRELEKLCCLAAEKAAIGAEEIKAATLQQCHEDGWKLGEAVFKRNGAQAIRICNGLMDNGTPLIVLVRQLRSQFQTDSRVASMIACGQPPEAVTKAFPYMRDFILRQHLEVAKTYGLKKLLQGLIAIDDAELAAKSSSSSADPQMLMQALIAKLTTP